MIFVIAQRHRIQPPSQAGVGFGLGSESPVCFLADLGRGGIELRRHQGPTGGGVPNPTRVQAALRGGFLGGELQNDDVGCVLQPLYPGQLRDPDHPHCTPARVRPSSGFACGYVAFLSVLLPSCLGVWLLIVLSVAGRKKLGWGLWRAEIFPPGVGFRLAGSGIIVILLDVPLPPSPL